MRAKEEEGERLCVQREREMKTERGKNEKCAREGKEKKRQDRKRKRWRRNECGGNGLQRPRRPFT